jgi:hypothetical protein
MTSSATKNLLVFASFLLLVGIAGFSYEFYAIHTEKLASAELESRIQGERATSATLESLRAIQVNNTAELDKIDSIVIARENPVPFLDIIEKTAKRFNLELRVGSVTVTEGKGSRDDTLSVMLETEGSWKQTIAFVHAIESLPYRVLVDDMSITTDVTSGVAAPVKQVWHGSATLVLNVK